MDEKVFKEQYVNVIVLVLLLKLLKEKGKFVIDNRIKSLILNREYVYLLLILIFINLLLLFFLLFFIKIVFDFIFLNFLNKIIIVVFIFFV